MMPALASTASGAERRRRGSQAGRGWAAGRTAGGAGPGCRGVVFSRGLATGRAPPRWPGPRAPWIRGLRPGSGDAQRTQASHLAARWRHADVVVHLLHSRGQVLLAPRGGANASIRNCARKRSVMACGLMSHALGHDPRPSSFAEFGLDTGTACTRLHVPQGAALDPVPRISHALGHGPLPASEQVTRPGAACTHLHVPGVVLDLRDGDALRGVCASSGEDLTRCQERASSRPAVQLGAGPPPSGAWSRSRDRSARGGSGTSAQCTRLHAAAHSSRGDHCATPPLSQDQS